MTVALRCRVCEDVGPAPAGSCRRCKGPTDASYDWARLRETVSRETIRSGPESLWRYLPLLPVDAARADGPGWTPLLAAPELSEALGVDVRLKLETANPTRSFKDRIAALAAAAAAEQGLATLCCASTGNLGEAVAAAADAAGLEAIVLAPEWAAQTIEGAQVFSVDGSYDDCERLALELAGLFPWGFVGGNLHPYAIEGAKTISYELAEQLDWTLPDAVVCPVASGGLFAKLAQGFAELGHVGLVEAAPPRMLGAQPAGSAPIAAAYADDRSVGHPAYGDLAIGAARASGGAIVPVPDDEIVESLDFLTRMTGVEADLAVGAALAGLRRAVADRSLATGSRVVLVVTGSDFGPSGEPLDPIVPGVDAFLARLGVSG